VRWFWVQARIAGLSTQGSLEDVARRLKYLDSYGKLKAAGLTNISLPLPRNEVEVRTHCRRSTRSFVPYFIT
jgi:hypothetical protein